MKTTKGEESISSHMRRARISTLNCRSAEYESLTRIVEEFQADLDRIVDLVVTGEDDQHKAQLLQVAFYLREGLKNLAKDERY